MQHTAHLPAVFILSRSGRTTSFRNTRLVKKIYYYKVKAYSTADGRLLRKQVMISRNAKDRRTAAAYSLFAVFSAKHYI